MGCGKSRFSLLSVMYTRDGDPCNLLMLITIIIIIIIIIKSLFHEGDT